MGFGLARTSVIPGERKTVFKVAAPSTGKRRPNPAALAVNQGAKVGDDSASSWQYVQQVGLVANTRDA